MNDPKINTPSLAPTPETWAEARSIQKSGVDWHYSAVLMAKKCAEIERERDEARLALHQLTSGKYGQIHLATQRDLAIAALNEWRAVAENLAIAVGDVKSHRREDHCGSHVLWIGESTFLVCDTALTAFEKLKGAKS